MDERDDQGAEGVPLDQGVAMSGDAGTVMGLGPDAAHEAEGSEPEAAGAAGDGPR